MFEVLESVSPDPIRILTVKGLRYEPGRVIELAEVDGNPSCIVSDGNKPFGIVGDFPDEFGLVPVWFDSMVFRTDIFELSVTYEMGDSLYVSERGILTNEKCYSNSILVGHIISAPGYEKDWMEVNWL